MGVAEFIRDTLVQIVAGVNQAQEIAEPLGAVVNALDDAPIIPKTMNGLEIHSIEFDVEGTTESTISGGARAAVLGIGAGLESASMDSVVL